MKCFLGGLLILIWTENVIMRSDCNYEVDPDYFTCTARGNFSNYNDRNCSTYFSCIKLRSGDLLQQNRRCPKDTQFNRDTNGCDYFYECPCGLPPPTTTTDKAVECSPNKDATLQCSQSGCYKDPRDPFCENYVYCYVDPKGKVYQVNRTCLSGTYFNISSNVCGCSVAAGYGALVPDQRYY